MIASAKTGTSIRDNRHGFTLIELLVVIAIIAILAAILFPVFAKVREKARQTACLSNEKQIGLGLMQYVQDNDETFPCGSFTGYGQPALPGSWNGWGVGWAGRIYPYVKSTAVFKCPDDSSGANPTVSYAMNTNFIPDTNTGQGITVAQLGTPVKTVYLFEVSAHNSPNVSDFTQEAVSGTGNGLEDTLTGYSYYATGQMMNYGDTHGLPTGVMIDAKGRHTDGSNFMMADGHVKWARPSGVSPGWNSTGNEQCNTNAGNWWLAEWTTCPDGRITFSRD